MSKSKKKPYWYSPYTKPRKPTKPAEFFTQLKKEQVVFAELKYDDVVEIDVEKLVKESEGKKVFLVLDHDRSWWNEDDSCQVSARITTQKYEKAPNPRYKIELIKYEKELEVWKERCKEWKVIQAKELEEKEAKMKAFRKKQYEKLKKEFEG